MKYENIIVTIYTYENCLSGRKIKNVRDAIVSDAFEVWDDDKIKKTFRFGNGTQEDWKRFIKDNKEKVIPTKQFFEIVDSLPNAKAYYDWLQSVLHY